MNRCKHFSITGSTLKIIAMILMVIDHIGAVIIENGLFQAPFVLSNPPLLKNLQTADIVLRTLGRPSFPIFCFLLVEGFVHTHNKRKYGLRLLLFAFISEIPFNLALSHSVFYPNSQNVFFTLLIGFLVMAGFQYFREKPFLQLCTLILGPVLARFLYTDYSFHGVILIEALYLFRYFKLTQTIAGSICLYFEPPAIAAFLPLWFYNGQRGKSLKYFFYLFYPVHLLLFSLIAMFIVRC